MKIAVVYQYYQGHSAPGHSLIYELTQHLAERGHEVTVVSGETGYMRTDQPKRRWYRRLLRCEQDGQVEVVRTYTYSELHRSYFGRLLSFISFSITAPFGLLRVKRPDVVLASSPPIFPMFSIWLVCKFRRIPMVLEVRDLWPESAVQMGILRNRHLIRIMAWMERLLYDQAIRIVTLTRGIRDDIHGRGWSAEKLEVVTCGVDTAMLRPDAEGGLHVRREHGWEGRSVVMYVGAMGEANNLDVVLEAAGYCTDPEVLFVLLGDGMKRAELVRKVAELELANVQVLDPVAKEVVSGYINAADVCLVTLLDIPLFKGAIPTKLLDYMACGRPVLCGVGGEAQEIIEAAGAGLSFQANDARRLVSLVDQLIAAPSRRMQMGQAGVSYVHAHFDAQKNRQAMEQLLCKAACDGRASGFKAQ